MCLTAFSTSAIYCEVLGYVSRFTLNNDSGKFVSLNPLEYGESIRIHE